jgi:hypothetical protein
MNRNSQIYDLFVDLEKEQFDWKKDVIINKSKFLEKIEEIEKSETIFQLKRTISFLISVILYPKNDTEGLINIDQNGDTLILKKGALIEELKQIEESQTNERAYYYDDDEIY